MVKYLSSDRNHLHKQWTDLPDTCYNTFVTCSTHLAQYGHALLLMSNQTCQQRSKVFRYMIFDRTHLNFPDFWWMSVMKKCIINFKPDESSYDAHIHVVATVGNSPWIKFQQCSKMDCHYHSCIWEIKFPAGAETNQILQFAVSMTLKGCLVYVLSLNQMCV